MRDVLRERFAGTRARASAEPRRALAAKLAAGQVEWETRSASRHAPDAQALGRTLARALRASPPWRPTARDGGIERLGDDAVPGDADLALARGLVRGPGSPPARWSSCGARSARAPRLGSRSRVAACCRDLAASPWPWASIRSPAVPARA